LPLLPLARLQNSKGYKAEKRSKIDFLQK